MVFSLPWALPIADPLKTSANLGILGFLRAFLGAQLKPLGWIWFKAYGLEKYMWGNISKRCPEYWLAKSLNKEEIDMYVSTFRWMLTKVQQAYSVSWNHFIKYLSTKLDLKPVFDKLLFPPKLKKRNVKAQNIDWTSHDYCDCCKSCAKWLAKLCPLCWALFGCV